MAVACTKPVDLGYPEELWTTRILALHARIHGPEAGHPCLAMLTKTILRGIRVDSKAELKARIMHYLQDLNADPVVFRWRYKLEEESVS